MTASHAQRALVSGCSHCDIINQMKQIRHRTSDCSCLFIPKSSNYCRYAEILRLISISVWHWILHFAKPNF